MVRHCKQICKISIPNSQLTVCLVSSECVSKWWGIGLYIYKVLILNSKNSKKNDKLVFTLISIINSTNKSRSWLKGTKYKIELKTKLSTNVMGEYQNHCKYLEFLH